MERRKFFKTSAGLTGGMSLSDLAIDPAQSPSKPTNLKITDIRGCTVRCGGENYPILKFTSHK